MTLLQGIKLYPKAVAWSVLISTCIAMEGYDISLVNNFYGFPQFNEKYGERLDDGSYQVPARVSIFLSFFLFSFFFLSILFLCYLWLEREEKKILVPNFNQSLYSGNWVSAMVPTSEKSLVFLSMAGPRSGLDIVILSWHALF